MFVISKMFVGFRINFDIILGWNAILKLKWTQNMHVTLIELLKWQWPQAVNCGTALETKHTSSRTPASITRHLWYALNILHVDFIFLALWKHVLQEGTLVTGAKSVTRMKWAKAFLRGMHHLHCKWARKPVVAVYAFQMNKWQKLPFCQSLNARFY